MTLVAYIALLAYVAMTFDDGPHPRNTPRLLDMLRQRNIMATPERLSTGRSLFLGSLSGGSHACGRNTGALIPGNRADFVILDGDHPRLAGRRGDDIMDSWIFSGNANPVRDVYVGGVKVIEQGCHRDQDQIEYRFRKTLKALSA